MVNRNSAHRQSSTSDPFIDPTAIPGPTSSVAHIVSQDGSLDTQPENVTSASSDFITTQRRAAVNPVYRSPELIKAGTRKIFITKWLFIGVLVAIK
jgi:hypothetical protein